MRTRQKVDYRETRIPSDDAYTITNLIDQPVRTAADDNTGPDPAPDNQKATRKRS